MSKVEHIHLRHPGSGLLNPAGCISTRHTRMQKYKQTHDQFIAIQEVHSCMSSALLTTPCQRIPTVLFLHTIRSIHTLLHTYTHTQRAKHSPAKVLKSVYKLWSQKCAKISRSKRQTIVLLYIPYKRLHTEYANRHCIMLSFHFGWSQLKQKM